MDAENATRRLFRVDRPPFRFDWDATPNDDEWRVYHWLDEQPVWETLASPQKS